MSDGSEVRRPSAGTAERPLRVAVVGSGPAGFYAAGQLLANSALTAEVDVYERLATPWGLVRAGVAPDHPKIKSVTRLYEKTARLPGFRFHGNVEIGRDLDHEELIAAYHAVVYAVGAPIDRRTGIPGESLHGSHAATEFVAWYNGHPDYAGRRFDLSSKRAVVIGNGNVALDVARMLVLDGSELRATDTADHALETLEASSIEEVVVLGRRGPAQAAYTTPELRELGEAADVVVDPAEAELDAASRAHLESEAAAVTARQNVEIVAEYARRAAGRRRRIVLRFCASPVEIVGSERVEGVRIVRNELVDTGDGRLSARPTAREETIECGLVLRSIGYRGTPIPGVPFDERRSTIRNRGGRVIREGTDMPVPGVYTAGWVKRGPSGVIGTNKKCAQETIDHLVDDLQDGLLPEPTREPGALLDLLVRRGVTVVDYAGWEQIDVHERAAGEPQGRPRVKLVHREQQLQHAARPQHPYRPLH
ncbi:FAD-dependent oxidoreductase [Conexibacter woesei]|uniref:ferredoxin--NADP(+) reductase n=1 Tax=Conexibacter woesei (strain DSM 14684 / CCUG 47730 / CIP 108061 / JCM 11494 / NBRC 100937 / ID131577) TaxID=469383 RepID=D3F7E6_CONWI|nr:FAD-dependent oxidoreductase [Conexibacter woesei]ADB50808.1 FAD-dependent pyridine nucleotide-disulphide oxidoreductase [Conexibacter woesei DSM 14684]